MLQHKPTGAFTGPGLDHPRGIIVLEDGRITERGTHEELAAQPGSYRTLCEIQGALDTQIAEDLSATGGTASEN